MKLGSDHRINAIIEGMNQLARASDQNNRVLEARIVELEKRIDLLEGKIAKADEGK